MYLGPITNSILTSKDFLCPAKSYLILDVLKNSIAFCDDTYMKDKSIGSLKGNIYLAVMMMQSQCVTRKNVCISIDIL